MCVRAQDMIFIVTNLSERDDAKGAAAAAAANSAYAA